MTWSSADAAGGVWFPARPAMLPALGGADAWAPDELLSLDPLAAGDAAGAAPSADELRAAAEAAREQELAEEQERLLADAYERGRADGDVAGRADERSRLAASVAAAEQALDALRAGEARWAGQIEENICALAVAVARQVIGREVAGDAATLTDLVRRAIAEFPIDQPVSIRVNPGDLATMTAARPRTILDGGSAGSTTDGAAAAAAGGATGGIAPNRDVRWIADPVVVTGGCIVEGRERIVDGRVDTALERIYRQLTGNHA